MIIMFSGERLEERIILNFPETGTYFGTTFSLEMKQFKLGLFSDEISSLGGSLKLKFYLNRCIKLRINLW